MDEKKIGTAAGAVGALSLLVQFVPGWSLSQWSASGFQQKLPVMFGTVGQTFTTYKYLIDTAGPLVTVLLGIGLGYYVGKRIDLRADYRRFLGVVGVGSAVGVVILWAGIITFGRPLFPLDSGDVLLLALSFAKMLVTVTLVVTVGAFAGAALAQFRADGYRSPGRPTPNNTDAPSSAERTANSEPSEPESQPAR